MWLQTVYHESLQLFSLNSDHTCVQVQFAYKEISQEENYFLNTFGHHCVESR